MKLKFFTEEQIETYKAALRAEGEYFVEQLPFYRAPEINRISDEEFTYSEWYDELGHYIENEDGEKIGFVAPGPRLRIDSWRSNDKVTYSQVHTGLFGQESMEVIK